MGREDVGSADLRWIRTGGQSKELSGTMKPGNFSD
jgi:hypothetical protein